MTTSGAPSRVPAMATGVRAVYSPPAGQQPYASEVQPLPSRATEARARAGGAPHAPKFPSPSYLPWWGPPSPGCVTALGIEKGRPSKRGFGAQSGKG